MSEAARIENLSFRYAFASHRVLADIHLSLKAGETVLLLGPSGSGKSTLALTLNGLIPHLIEGEMAGKVTVFGLDTAGTPVAQLAARTGMVFQDPESQFCTLTIEEEVAFGLENLCVPPAGMPGRIAAALRAVGLEGMEKTRLDRLSGGQKQRLALACALATEPDLLVLDEPTANLDPAGSREFFHTLGRLKRTGRYTILLIEHRLDECIALAGRAVVLSPEGSVFAEGRPQDIFARYAESLESFGVWMPQVTELALQLPERGIDLLNLPLTVPEAAEALLSLIRPSTSLPESPAASPEKGIAVRLDAVRFAYPRGRQALAGVDLAVPEGSFFALVGPNGSGKSTLALHLIGTLAPQAGSVELFGRQVETFRPEEMAATVGYVFQNPEHQFITDTVYHELAYSLRLSAAPESEKSARIEAALREFGLEGCEERHPYKLSQGQKRRLSAATMLISGQRLLILDEPTFGQDRASAHALMERMRLLNARGTTLLMITHDMSLVARYADRVAVMQEGRPIFTGSPGQLFDREDILREGRLIPPPIRELSEALRKSRPEFLPASTIEEFLKAMEG
ncbi:MAG: ATP-binding cassette domain-containing protein [Armatimonadetes bacterium]|nr:ATP-binding cassette domain-containing protein [Armatimonadota bacterium]